MTTQLTLRGVTVVVVAFLVGILMGNLFDNVDPIWEGVSLAVSALVGFLIAAWILRLKNGSVS